MKKTNKNLEAKVKKMSRMKKLIAATLISATAMIGGYKLGQEQGYKHCTKQQIMLEQNIRQHKYQNLKRINDKYFVAEVELAKNCKVVYLLDKEGNKKTHLGPYTEIIATEKGYECRFTKKPGPNFTEGYIDYFDKEIRYRGTKSFISW